MRVVLPLKTLQTKIREWADFEKWIIAWLTPLHPQSIIVELKAGGQELKVV